MHHRPWGDRRFGTESTCTYSRPTVSKIKSSSQHQHANLVLSSFYLALSAEANISRFTKM